MTDARSRLVEAAAQTLREGGLAAASARSIAARARLSQGLIFYHFGTVSELLEAASNDAVRRGVDHYQARFDAVTSVNELLALGRELHEHERAAGNVAMMAQLMSGAQHDEVLARAARHALAAWTERVEEVLRRTLAGSPLADIADVRALARAVSAGFIGLQLYEAVDPLGAADALDALRELGVLVEVVNDLGPVARRALRGRLRGRRPRTR